MVKSFVKSALAGLRRGLLRQLNRLPVGDRACIICDRRLHRFLPYRDGARGLSPLLAVLDIVGSDVENFECPWCGAHDRERHLFLYLRETGMLTKLAGARILHIAPERRLTDIIAHAGPAKYVRGDLFPSSPGIERLDITGLAFPDDTFDLVLANHVMEHVPDDLRALAEVLRVLKPGGEAILQTPFSSRLFHSWSDAGIDSDRARFLAYGQEDHVRLYGRDIFERFISVGFESRVCSHEELLPHVDGRRFGVNTQEPFMLFRKPAQRMSGTP